MPCGQAGFARRYPAELAVTRQGRMRVAIGLFLVCAALPGCFVIRFGDHDRTEYHEVPPRIPVSEWAEGSPRYSVVFEGSSTAFDDGDPKPDGEAAMFIVRQLRVARVFQSIYVPGSPRIPSDAARLRVEAHFRAVDHTAGNFAKALIPPRGAGKAGRQGHRGAVFARDLSRAPPPTA